jgi:SAM-dependent methyltransferase
MHLENSKEWFSTWFNSPYYHLLYDNRDEREAEAFLKILVEHLQINSSSKVLDLACGAGRHSIVLNELGVDVEGCDLSPNSINEAKTKSNNSIPFFVHDMRNPLEKKYDIILNLFTSFGYFDNLSDNLKVLNSIFDALNPGGIVVIDFMNADKVIRDLKLRQEIQKGDVLFSIKREVNNHRIIKSIAFEDKGQSYFFQEKVQALSKSDFSELFKEANLELIESFGSYQLEDFDSSTSDRLISICKKA